MDWATRHVLSWRLSNTMEAAFCVEALKEAIDKYGPPKIFNTDQGSQFTSNDFIKVLTDAKVDISMDGRGRYLDNIFIERLWRSLKYEAIYLTEMSDGFNGHRLCTYFEATLGYLAEGFVAYNNYPYDVGSRYKNTGRKGPVFLLVSLLIID